MTRDLCRYEVVSDLLDAERTLAAAGRRAEEAGRRAEEAGRRTEEAGRRTEEAGRRAEETSQELAAERKILAEAQVAVEVAKSRTMDMMRERGMVHARGILEVAELFEKPLHPQAAKGRTALWQAILRERPELAACLHARSGWAPHQAPREIEALYRNLNSRMHQAAQPAAAARNGGVQLQLGGAGSGLSQIQSNALTCICESFFVRYEVVSDLGESVDAYPGVADLQIGERWRKSNQSREARLPGLAARASQQSGSRRA